MGKCDEKMMAQDLDRNTAAFKINLANIEGDGSFQCPKCGKSISPDDESEDNYKILDTKVINDELSELVICCAKCGSTIVLTGFEQGVDA